MVKCLEVKEVAVVVGGMIETMIPMKICVVGTATGKGEGGRHDRAPRNYRSGTGRVGLAFIEVYSGSRVVAACGHHHPLIVVMGVVEAVVRDIEDTTEM